MIIDNIYGYAKIRSWFEVNNGEAIGMGSTTNYDRDGKMTGHREAPTGVVFYLRKKKGIFMTFNDVDLFFLIVSILIILCIVGLSLCISALMG